MKKGGEKLEIKVVSFNIRSCGDINGNSIPERAKRLAKIVLPLEADIICFQEYSQWWAPHIDEIFGDRYEMFNKYRAENDFESTPILWRKDKFTCTETGCFWLSDTPHTESKGWDEKYDCFRICLWVILEDKKSGEKFTVFNTHFGFGDKGQVASTNLIYNKSKEISNYPTFITGDFNMTPSSLGYEEMRQHFIDVNAVTVNDLRDTYHGYDLSTSKDAHIDYCFVSNKIKPISQKMIEETIDGKFPSDHFGLLVNIEI